MLACLDVVIPGNRDMMSEPASGIICRAYPALLLDPFCTFFLYCSCLSFSCVLSLSRHEFLKHVSHSYEHLLLLIDASGHMNSHSLRLLGEPQPGESRWCLCANWKRMSLPPEHCSTGCGQQRAGWISIPPPGTCGILHTTQRSSLCVDTFRFQLLSPNTLTTSEPKRWRELDF